MIHRRRRIPGRTVRAGLGVLLVVSYGGASCTAQQPGDSANSEITSTVASPPGPSTTTPVVTPESAALTSPGTTDAPADPSTEPPPTSADRLGDVEFVPEVVDPEFSGDVKALADIDGDGDDDVIVGGLTLRWYRSPEWTPFEIATADNEFTTDMAVADVDGDGDIDVIAPDGFVGVNVAWFENGAEWQRHPIGAHGSYVHDLGVCDVDGDGSVDVVTQGHGPTHVFLNAGARPWADHDLTGVGLTDQGLGVGDVDADGDCDLVGGGVWIENAGDGGTSWRTHRVAEAISDEETGLVADLTGDGRADIVFAAQHAAAELTIYVGPADPREGTWTPILLDPAMGSHRLAVSDLDGDGSLDLVAGLELAELSIYLNRGGESLHFDKRVLSTEGAHNVQVGDTNADGVPDILAANYIDVPPIVVWRGHGVAG